MAFNGNQCTLKKVLAPSFEVAVDDRNGKKPPTKSNGKGRVESVMQSNASKKKHEEKGVIQSNGFGSTKTKKKASKEEQEEEERLKQEEQDRLEGWQVIRRPKRSSSVVRIPNNGNRNNGWRVDNANRSHQAKAKAASQQGRGSGGRKEDEIMNERVKAIFDKATLKLKEQRRLKEEINSPKPASNDQPESTDNANQVKAPSQPRRRNNGNQSSSNGQQPRPRENGNQSDQLKPAF